MRKQEIINYYYNNYCSVENFKKKEPILYQEAIKKYAIGYIDKTYYKSDNKFLKIANQAKLYKSIKDIRESNNTLYKSMSLYGLDFFDIPKVYYSIEFLKKIVKDYSTLSELRNNIESKYIKYIIDNNLCDVLDISRRKNSTKYTISEIENIIKDNNYTTYKDIRQENQQLYRFIIDNNLGDNFNLKFKRKPNSYWNKESLEKYIKNNNIQSLKELRQKNESAATSVSRLKIAEELGLKKSRKQRWTEESALMYLNNKDYESLSDLRHDNIGLYSFLKKTGVLPHLVLVEKNRRWTDESIKQYIKDNNIVCVSELIKKDMSVYITAKKLGIMDDLGIINIDKNHRKENIQQIILRKNFKDESDLHDFNKNFYIYAKKFNLQITN